MIGLNCKKNIKFRVRKHSLLAFVIDAYVTIGGYTFELDGSYRSEHTFWWQSINNSEKQNIFPRFKMSANLPGRVLSINHCNYLSKSFRRFQDDSWPSETSQNPTGRSWRQCVTHRSDFKTALQLLFMFLLSLAIPDINTRSKRHLFFTCRIVFRWFIFTLLRRVSRTVLLSASLYPCLCLRECFWSVKCYGI